MLSPSQHFRYHSVQQACLLFLAEALLKAALPGFPFSELILAQGAIVGGFLTVKTISNVDKAKYEKPISNGD